MSRHNFKELLVWQKAKDLAKDIYHATNAFPKEEIFGLSQQIRRSAISILSNIAEGCGRGTDQQFLQYLQIAQGSAFELEAQVIIANELNFFELKTGEVFLNQISEIQKMINGLSDRIKRH